MEIRLFVESSFDELLRSRSISMFQCKDTQFVLCEHVVRVDRQFTLKGSRRFLWHLLVLVDRAKLLMESRLGGRELDRLLIFSDCIWVVIGFGIGLRQNLMDTPRLRIGCEHLAVAIFGNQEVRSTTVVENIDIVRREFR